MKKHGIIWLCIIIFALVCILLTISILNICNLNRITADFLSYFNTLITPVGIIFGLIVGYPLLKKKLLENYVSRQFDIMHEANRILRKGCFDLMNKYPYKGYISIELRVEYVKQAIQDIETLLSDAFDANPDAVKYLKLTATSLREFEKLYPRKIKHHRYYEETLGDFVYTHLKHTYNCAKSVGVNLNASTKIRHRLRRKLDNFVFDNNYVDVDSVDYSLDHYHASQLLVVFFSNSFSTFKDNNPIYCLACYKAAPSPCPIARILFFRGIYLPVVLRGKDNLSFLGLDRQLDLIYFKNATVTSAETGKQQRSYYTCYYANIAPFGYVEGTMKDKFAMDGFYDNYLDIGGLSSEQISKFEVLPHEMIKIEIEADVVQDKYRQNRRRLIRKMKKERRVAKNSK